MRRESQYTQFDAPQSLNHNIHLGIKIIILALNVQVGMDARSLAARLPSRGPADSQGRKGQTDKGAKNAQQRRLRAFRQALIRAVEPSHQAFLRELQQQQPSQQQPEQSFQQQQQPQQQPPPQQPQQQQQIKHGFSHGEYKDVCLI